MLKFQQQSADFQIFCYESIRFSSVTCIIVLTGRRLNLGTDVPVNQLYGTRSF